jgi:hypothetical protein
MHFELDLKDDGHSMHGCNKIMNRGLTFTLNSRLSGIMVGMEITVNRKPDLRQILLKILQYLHNSIGLPVLKFIQHIFMAYLILFFLHYTEV